MTDEWVTLRVRMGSEDAHYGGNLVAGATTMRLFGDVVTELAIRNDGDEGLLVGFEKVEFRAPVYAGDFIEARGRIVGVGRTSRTCEFEAWKVIAARPEVGEEAAEVLTEPVLVARAVGTTVVPQDRQQK
ncbi:MAG TPA: hotdog domain-containing protein [Actinomycetota bacterium]|jgi:3-aminobutyryl-CoA ammonia-lyase|nr:hotdog domain-containing protein [Actinomycetota bacterium]